MRMNVALCLLLVMVCAGGAHASIAPGWSQVLDPIEYHADMVVVGCNGDRVFSPIPNSSDCSALYLEYMNPPGVEGAMYGCEAFIGYAGMACYVPTGGGAPSIPAPTGFASESGSGPVPYAVTIEDASVMSWAVVCAWVGALGVRLLARAFRGVE